MIRSILFLVTLIVLSGCVATGYGQKGGFNGGYEETQLSPDVFQVAFSGNDSTSMQRATDFTMLRSAELALENGYPYFVVMSEKQWIETSELTTPVVSSSAGGSASSGGSYAGSSASSSAGGKTLRSDEPRTSNVIRLLKDRTNQSSIVYDAQFLIDSLRAKYDIGAE